jgi:hypothetical protein
VEGLSEALALEVKPLGLKVTIVEPGGFRTDWAGVSMAFAKPLEAYASTVGAMRGYIEAHNGKQPGDPRKAAQAILKLVDMPEAPLRLPLGNDAMAVLRNGYKTSAEELEHWADITKSTDFDGSRSPIPVTRSWTSRADSGHPTPGNRRCRVFCLGQHGGADIITETALFSDCLFCLANPFKYSIPRPDSDYLGQQWCSRGRGSDLNLNLGFQ